MRTAADADTARMTRRILLVLVLILAALVPAGAAYATADKATVLAGWTQPGRASDEAWQVLRQGGVVALSSGPGQLEEINGQVVAGQDRVGHRSLAGDR